MFVITLETNLVPTVEGSTPLDKTFVAVGVFLVIEEDGEAPLPTDDHLKLLSFRTFLSFFFRQTFSDILT